MREGIHPEYKVARIACACGNVIETRSTRGDFHVEICSNCHPFFTGKQKLMDTAGRIEKFKTRYAATPAAKPEVKAAPAPAPTSNKKIETRAEKRAKVNAGKKAPSEKPGAKPEEKSVEAAAPAKTEPAKA